MPGQLVPRPPAGSIDLSFRDFESDRALGRASLYGDIANAAAEKICGLYGKSPASVVKLIPVGGGLIDNSRGIFDDLCKDIAPPPAPPQSQFNGGQCDNVRYNWVLTAEFRNADINGVPQQPYSRNFSGSFWGRIESVGLSPYAEEESGPFLYRGHNAIVATGRGDGSFPTSNSGLFTLVGGSRPEIQSFSGLVITKFDNTADTCGNPPVSYPPPSAGVPNMEGTTIINIAPNTPITVPVKIIPTFAPVIGIFRPEFNVNVGGINVNISAGGFTFSPTVEIPVGVNFPINDPRSAPPSPLPISPPASSSGSECDLQPVLDSLQELHNEVEECCDRFAPFSEPSTDKIDVRFLHEGTGGTFNLPSRTFTVTVEIVNRPGIEKTQDPASGVRVLYCGWGWFVSQGGQCQRLPMDADKKAFKVPQYTEGSFTVSLYAGYTAKVFAWFSKPPQNN